jgi:hypothetical protein
VLELGELSQADKASEDMQGEERQRGQAGGDSRDEVQHGGSSG